MSEMRGTSPQAPLLNLGEGAILHIKSLANPVHLVNGDGKQVEARNGSYRFIKGTWRSFVP